MALHDSLRELVTVRGAAVVGEAEELRGALDDFLAEDEATLGELNLLVDAVRLGALRRVLDVMEHGAAPEPAIREAGAALARDRGTDDPTRSCWALASLCFALGRVDEPLVRTFAGGSGTLSVPGRPAPPPGTGAAERPATQPLPDAPPAGPSVPSVPAVSPPAPPTEVGPPTPTPTPAPHGGPVGPVVHERRSSRAGVLLLVVLVALVVGGLVAAGVILLGSDPESSADDPSASDGTEGSSSDGAGGTVPDSAMLVPYAEGETSRIHQVDAFTGAGAAVTPEGVDARLPSIAPDRSVMTYQVGQSPSVVMIVDLVTGVARPLFPADSPCARAGRPAWSPDGTRLAMLCDPGGDGESDGIWVAAADGSAVTGPVVDDPEVSGSPTWVSETEIVYGRDDAATDTTFWRTDVDEGGPGEQVAVDVPGNLSHIDWSPRAERLLVLSSPTDEEEGAIYTVALDGSDPTLVSEGPFAHPVWSPEGDAIGVTLLDETGTEVLGRLSLDDPDNPEVVPGPPPGEVGIPVWGTR